MINFLIVTFLTIFIGSSSGNVMVLSKSNGEKFCSIVYEKSDYTIFITATKDDFIMNIYSQNLNEVEELFYFTNSAYIWTDGGYANYKPTISTDAGIGIHIGNDFGFITALFEQDKFYIEIDHNNFEFKANNFRNLSYSFDSCSSEVNND